MSRFTPHLPRRAALGAALAVALLLAGPFAVANTAHAYACRSDPVVVVNGATVDIVSTLWTTSSTVKELDYTITVPAGSLINKTTLTVGLGFPEKVTYVFSSVQKWGTLTVAATVQTQPGVAPFAKQVQATPVVSGLLTGTSSASGMSNTTVVVAVGNLVMI